MHEFIILSDATSYGKNLFYAMKKFDAEKNIFIKHLIVHTVSNIFVMISDAESLKLSTKPSQDRSSMH